jgi:diguanylate cyclase (GGDEF)-like protein
MARQKFQKDDDILTKAEQFLAAPALPPHDLISEYAALAAAYRKQQRKLNKTIVISDSYQGRLKELMKMLEDATLKYRQLKDVALPLCMYCKKVRSDSNYWQQLETYFGTHADIMFSHGICPDCVGAAYRQLGEWRGREALPKQLSSAKVASRTVKEQGEDADLGELRALHSQSVVEGNPLAPELERFIAKYAKMSRRFAKTILISDSYQSQLMDFKARLEITARTDLLTGLANRWEIMARLEAEQSRSERHDAPFSLLICDVDYFKDVNDTYGHSAGDRMLKGIADALSGAVRSEDFCGRWGGEEFLVMLPETGLAKAQLVAGKLLGAVRDMRVPWEGHKLSVTMSIGVGEFRSGMTIDHFIKVVDDALYSAKKSGRDRCMVAG